jgi:hypothetical protein
MFGRAIIVFAVILSTLPALAQLPLPIIPLPLPSMEGTPEDRANCAPDVQRYCQSALATNDNMRVLACLQQNRNRISAACQGVLIKYGQ